MLTFRKALLQDQDAIWEILQNIIKKGSSFAYPSNLTKEEMLAYWLAEDKHAYVALEDDEVIATFFMKDNQPGRGSHIANAAYAIAEKHAGKGIGQKVGEYSLIEAKRLGYKAMQFNLVVKSNVRAVSLWKRIGFEIIGEIPDAFFHPQEGYTNAYVMYRKL